MDFFVKVDSIPRRVGVFRILNDFHGLKKPQAKFQETKKKQSQVNFFPLSRKIARESRATLALVARKFRANRTLLPCFP